MNKTNRKKSSVLKTPKSSDTGSVPVIAEEFEVLKTPVKSFSDKKEYRVIKLKNGLTACLISDTSEYEDSASSESESDSESESGSNSDNTSSWETESGSSACTTDDNDSCNKSKKVKDEVKLAAAALCVGVGSFSDPKDVPGLAHFLEHMVFMGSKKFPKENDFDSYITKHGGSDNGSTDSEVTTFYFECFEKYFLQALDKFSQFFISPLMKRDSLSRERESVESEFQMAVPSDDNRVEQLLLTLAERSSPVNSFSWGNLVSLRDNISEERLYEKLHEFRKRHYSANRMTVSVQARLPLDVLESYVVNCFSGVPNNNLPAEDFSCYSDNVFNTPEFTKLYYVKPVKDTCQIILTWIMPSLMSMYKSKPYDYVAWLIGHEGQGGLLSYLKKHLWAFSLEAGTGSSGADFNSLYTAFSVTVILTNEGFENLDKVIEAVFSYINLLKNVGPSERIFKEIQTIEDVSFRFDEEENPSDIVESVVENMQIYPPEDYLTGSELYFEYAPEEITNVLNYLIPSKMNIMALSPTTSTNIIYDKIEPWFKVHYTDQEIPNKWLEVWRNAESLPCFTLPEPNQFLTEDFSILPAEKKNPKYPQKIMDTPLTEIWYRKDQTFGLPVAYYYYYLFCPFSMESIENNCMMQIFILILNINLMEEGYPAKLADLEYTISSWERGILIKVVGYNEKLPKLIQLIAKYLRNCGDSFDNILFETAKSKQQQNVHNVLLKPSKLCNDVRSNILQKNYFLLLEKYLMFPNITYNMMKEFTRSVLKRLYIQGLIQGNLTAATALESTRLLLDELSFEPITSMDELKVLVNEIPKGEHCSRLYSLDKENINSTVTNYYQCGPLTVKDNVILEFILLLIEEPLFDTLRTKEQLGYSVFSTVRDTYGILGYSITVHTQADKYSTSHIDNRIEEFIKTSQRVLKNMSSKMFNQTKEALTKIKQVIDVDLEDEVDRNWDEIIYRKYMFDRLQLEIDAIQKLKITDILKWWDTYNIYNKTNNCKKLTVQVMGHLKSAILEDVRQLKIVQLPSNAVVENKLVELDLKDCTQLATSPQQFTEQDNVLRNDIEAIPVNAESATNIYIPTKQKFTGMENLTLCFVDDGNEISKQNVEENYFIKDVKNFKDTLKYYPDHTS